MHKFWALCVLFMVLEVSVAPPVDTNKEKKEKNEEIDDFGLEYGRYLQQVVQALEEDKEFAKKLENISAEQIRNGHIAKELEFVKHNVRSKLDELKRIEVDRLRKLVQEQMERTELGLYRDEDGHLLSAPDGRRWRTIPSHSGGTEGGVGDGNFWLGLNRKGVKIPHHLDINNPHSFEVDDLKKLIQSATSDLEALDKQRREEFKKYELEKEATYRESLKNMTETERKETEKHHEELTEKHKDHPKIHHPGSKPQLEQVWEDQDHMPKEEFNPRTFFAMHDVNGDGHLDVEEVEAILIPEVKKMYNPNNEEDDPAEMEEEFHRMREHIFNETDKNKDSLISLEEFLKMTEQQDFQQDEGWKGLDEQSVYSEAELEEYMRQRQMEMQQHPQYYGDQRIHYDVPNAQQQQGLPPHINYQAPQPGYPHQGYPQGNPQQYQGQQPHFQGQPSQQQFHGQPQQQQFHGQPQQPQFQGQPQQQQFQGQPQQQQFHGQPQQQQFHGQPQQQQFHGQPQQPQFQGHPQQPQFQGQPQQPQFHGQPQQVQKQPQQPQGQPQQFQGSPVKPQGNIAPSQVQEHPQGSEQYISSSQANQPPQKPAGSVNQVTNTEVKPNVP